MVRPALNDAEKRKMIAARFSPEARSHIEARAQKNGRTANAEVEALATEFLSYKPETIDLLHRIAAGIEAIEVQTRKTMRRDLTTWAAVSEMLAHVCDDLRPDNPLDDPMVIQSLQQLSEAEYERKKVVDQLAMCGVAVNENNQRPPMRGAPAWAVGLGAHISTRQWERAAIEAIPSDTLRATASSIFEQLLHCDADVASAREHCSELMEPYWRAEQAGREMGETERKIRATNRNLAAALRSRQWSEEED